MFETYVFDLDGTLLDTLDDLTDAVNAALSAYGCPVRTRGEVRSFVGNGIRLLIERAAPKDSPRPEILAEFKRFYGEHCCDKTKPYPGVEEMLRKLRARGARTAIVSNKADFAVQELSARYFGNLVLAAVGENEEAGVRKKPAPDSVFTALELVGGKKEGAVYVGDSEVDIETAANAGLPCVSVTWGFKSRKFLSERGASLLIDTPEELLKL